MSHSALMPYVSHAQISWSKDKTHFLSAAGQLCTVSCDYGWVSGVIRQQVLRSPCHEWHRPHSPWWPPSLPTLSPGPHTRPHSLCHDVTVPENPPAPPLIYPALPGIQEVGGWQRGQISAAWWLTLFTGDQMTHHMTISANAWYILALSM